MPDYRRNRVPGGTFFFTVNLLDRRSNLLVAQIDALRDAVRQVRARAPFHIDAWPHFRSFDLNNIDYQWLAGHSAF